MNFVFRLRPQAPGGAHLPPLATSHKLGRPCRWPLASCVFDYASGLASAAPRKPAHSFSAGKGDAA
jgi:hypothetical protein